MIAFFYGYSGGVKEAIRLQTAVFLKKNPQGLVQKLDLEELTHREQLADILLTRSFFDEKRQLILKGSFTVPGEELINLLQDYSQNEELIFREDATASELEKKNKPWFAFLCQRADVVKEWEDVRGAKLVRWVEEKFTQAGLRISSAALTRLLAGASGPRLEQEVEKIIAYGNYRGPLKTGGSAVIGEKDIEALIRSELAVNNFALVDAIAGRDQRRGLELLHRYLSAGEDPYAILGLLIYQFRNLLKIKSLTAEPVPYGQLTGLTKLHPFVVKKTYEQAKRFELGQLKNLYHQLGLLEQSGKKGQVDLAEGLFCFLAAV